MDKNKIILSRNVRPKTKRIAIICLSIVALGAIVAAGLENIDTEKAIYVVILVINTISAWVDGGR